MNFEILFEQHMQKVCDQHHDPAHDMLHVKRVVNMAKRLAQQENANLRIVVPAAYLHDCVYIAKTDDRRTKASRISADFAVELLNGWGYEKDLIPAIHHAIAAHSFSAKIYPETLEAKIVQDADRLDAMGATGVYRCFALSGILKHPLGKNEDPFCKTREPNDEEFTLDHFYVKLLHLQSLLNTNSAKVEGEIRLSAMKDYLASLERELDF